MYLIYYVKEFFECSYSKMNHNNRELIIKVLAKLRIFLINVNI